MKYPFFLATTDGNTILFLKKKGVNCCRIIIYLKLGLRCKFYAIKRPILFFPKLNNNLTKMSCVQKQMKS